ncbi:hypothetical protein PVAG01_09294 [Phlyctema vagabunda]|uniref:Uncharacterized protein n=1 Tax=Phlyctema vagabunda TaxID=108571 RepID=A0ABR4P6Z2_9HELO
MRPKFEGVEYLYATTRPDIPYALYTSERYLLLVPRVVRRVHPRFPANPYPTKRYRLELSWQWTDRFKATYGRDAQFTARNTNIGLDADEVVVGALLVGTDLVPSWEFRDIFSGRCGYVVDNHSMTSSSSAVDCFGALCWNLTQAAVPCPMP